MSNTDEVKRFMKSLGFVRYTSMKVGYDYGYTYRKDDLTIDEKEATFFYQAFEKGKREAELEGARKLSARLIERAIAYHDDQRAETISVLEVKDAYAFLKNGSYRAELRKEPQRHE